MSIYKPSLILSAYNLQKDVPFGEMCFFIIENDEIKGTVIVKRDDFPNFKPSKNLYYLDRIRDTEDVITDYNLEPVSKLRERWGYMIKDLNEKLSAFVEDVEEEFTEADRKYALRKYKKAYEALEELQDFLETTVDPVTGEMDKETDRLYDRIKNMINELYSASQAFEK